MDVEAYSDDPVIEYLKMMAEDDSDVGSGEVSEFQRTGNVFTISRNPPSGPSHHPPTELYLPPSATIPSSSTSVQTNSNIESSVRNTQILRSPTVVEHQNILRLRSWILSLNLSELMIAMDSRDLNTGGEEHIVRDRMLRYAIREKVSCDLAGWNEEIDRQRTELPFTWPVLSPRSTNDEFLYAAQVHTRPPPVPVSSAPASVGTFPSLQSIPSFPSHTTQDSVSTASGSVYTYTNASSHEHSMTQQTDAHMNSNTRNSNTLYTHYTNTPYCETHNLQNDSCTPYNTHNLNHSQTKISTAYVEIAPVRTEATLRNASCHSEAESIHESWYEVAARQWRFAFGAKYTPFDHLCKDPVSVDEGYVEMSPTDEQTQSSSVKAAASREIVTFAEEINSQRMIEKSETQTHTPSLLTLRSPPCSTGAVEEEVMPSWFLEELWEQQPVENRPFTEIRIGKDKFKALIDTGATRTLVGPRVKECLESYIIATSGRVRLANGKSERTSGCVAMKFESRGAGCILPVRVAPKLAYDVILGMDFIEKMEVEIRGKNVTWGIVDNATDAANEVPMVDAMPIRIEGAVASEDDEVSQGETRDSDEVTDDQSVAESSGSLFSTQSSSSSSSETSYHPSSPTTRRNRSSRRKGDIKGRRTDHHSRQKRSLNSSKKKQSEKNLSRAISPPPPSDLPSTVTNTAIQPLMSIVFPPDYNPFPHRTLQSSLSSTIPPLMSITCIPPADYKPRWDFREHEIPRRTRRVVRKNN